MQSGTQGWGEYLGGSGDGGGSRRAKFAGFLKAAGQAASEAKQSYYGRSNGGTPREVEGDWGDAEVATNGREQLVLFPSYARWRPPRSESRTWRAQSDDDLGGVEAEEREALIDVDVRGWVFRPNSGPPSRTERMVVGIAKTLCGLPSLPEEGQSGSSESSWRNPYATNSTTGQRMTDEEIRAAHAEVTARLAPFLYESVSEKKITIFIYNNETSTMIETYTCQKGHFSYRAPVDFVPTDVKVFVTPELAINEPVRIVEKSGISLISDIDDTIKHSAVHAGTREMFRNTFVKPLDDLTIQGVREWYTSLVEPPYNVEMHYVSNSPWQLFSLIQTYMRRAGLPQGSYHLKQYSGLLKGIFEPVADRKRGSLERIIRDFPGRRWILVGDAGEMDLEVYTEVALQFPGRILAIFIRDVGNLDGSSSSSQLGQSLPNSSSDQVLFENKFFTSSPSGSPAPSVSRKAPPAVPPPRRSNTSSTSSSNPSSVPATPRPSLPEVPQQRRPPSEVSAKKAPPVRPPKPKALQLVQNSVEAESEGPKPPLPQRRPTDPVTPQSTSSPSPSPNGPFPPPPKRRTLPPPFVPGQSTTPPPPGSTPSPYKLKTASSSSLPLPPHVPIADSPRTSQPQLTSRPTYYSAASGRYPGNYNEQPMTAEERKREMWLMRWAQAQRVLEAQGVILESWVIGSDVSELCRSIVESALAESKGDKSRR
ncbi:hypothetical protein BJ508DRAFT_409930 [Ascobolus immersus RN42]|uniref:Phosphatidate phosphatase APP1 catalytic domain-containing protein n=1 Tax=Ascobolus immersus RN42 TaxID=1160509 RepID=A0A3N4IP96_ASCIM|nr:hypothetical protein BJ508DRAFT_409930 [Ascobolus immersus RN42]